VNRNVMAVFLLWLGVASGCNNFQCSYDCFDSSSSPPTNLGVVTTHNCGLFNNTKSLAETECGLLNDGNLTDRFVSSPYDCTTELDLACSNGRNSTAAVAPIPDLRFAKVAE
jgi:hypothetical protein